MNLKTIIREFRPRFKLWAKKEKHCKKCCLWCRYFSYCGPSVEGDEDV